MGLELVDMEAVRRKLVSRLHEGWVTLYADTDGHIEDIEYACFPPSTAENALFEIILMHTPSGLQSIVIAKLTPALVHVAGITIPREHLKDLLQLSFVKDATGMLCAALGIDGGTLSVESYVDALLTWMDPMRMVRN